MCRSTERLLIKAIRFKIMRNIGHAFFKMHQLLMLEMVRGC